MDTGLLADGKLGQLQDGQWFVHCKHCPQEQTLRARSEEDAYGMLKEFKWRLSMPSKKYEERNWSCPSCAQWWSQDTTPTATDAAGSAGQLAAHAAAPSSDALYTKVEQLKEEVETLKAEVLLWKELLRGHVQMKDAHVAELRLLRKEIADLRAEFTAAQHPPLVSPPPGIE